MQKKYFYLIGQNIKTSLSPLLHNTLFHLKGNSNYCYRFFRDGTVPRLFQQAQKQQPMNQIDGLSITIPFKRWFHEQQSMKKNAASTNEENNIGIKIQYIGQFAKKTKIINTLVKEENDIMRGYNTDIFGVDKCLRKIQNIENVLVLGAGATSTTFVHYLQYWPACNTITIHNRSPKPIQTLCREYNKVISSKSSSSSQGKQINVIINTLPSQVILQNVEKYRQLMKKIKFAESCYIMDVNYRVQLGMLRDMLGLQKQQAMEFKGCTGLDMLIWQAIQQNRLFCLQKQYNQEKQQNYYRILRQLIDSVPSLTR